MEGGPACRRPVRPPCQCRPETGVDLLGGDRSDESDQSLRLRRSCSGVRVQLSVAGPGPCPGPPAWGLDPTTQSRPPGRWRTWAYEAYGVKQAQEWLGHSDPATTLRHYVRLTTAARAKAVAGLDEVTRAALGAAEENAAEDAQPVRDNVVALASRRR